MKLDNRHFALTMIDGVWYGVRELTVADNPWVGTNQETHQVKRIQYQGMIRAADRISVLLTKDDARRFDLTSDKAYEINRAINSQNIVA